MWVSCLVGRTPRASIRAAAGWFPTVPCTVRNTNPLHQHDRKTTAEKGYGSRWQKARAVYLQSHPLCVRCLAKGRYVKATVVDHIIPHRGDRKLFWDRDNWQALCKSCHDSKTMTEDRYEEFRYPKGRSKSL